MKKIWQLWLRINGWKKYIVFLMLDASVLIVSAGWLHEIMLSFFSEIGLVSNKICCVLYCIILVMIMSSVFYIAIRDVHSRYWLVQWLELTKLQQWIYELINLQVLGNVGLGLMLAFVDFQKIGVVSILLWYLVAYCFFVYLAVVCANNSCEFKRRKKRQLRVISVDNARWEIVFLEILEKVRCIETTLTIVLIFMFDIFLVVALKINGWELQLIVMLLIFLCEDKMFESHCKSTKYLAAININLKEYIGTQIVSTAVYSCTGVFFVALIYSEPVDVLICWLIGLYLSVFWTVTYEYMELVAHLSVIKKVLFEIVNLVMVFIPGVNILVIYQRVLRIRERW